MKKLFITLLVFILAISSLSSVGDIKYLIETPDGNTQIVDNALDKIRLEYAMEQFDLIGLDSRDISKEEIQEFNDFYESLVNETAEPNHLTEVSQRIFNWMYYNHPEYLDGEK